MTNTPSFPGFPREALNFFAEIADNNNREWFQAHKNDYEAHVQTPAQDFVIALGTRLQSVSSGFRFDTSLSGSGSIMRIYRDIRFSKDKSPYKTYLGIRFWEGKSRKALSSGLFFGLDASGAGMHVGQHMFSKEFLNAFRDAVDNESLGEELETALASVSTHAEIGGERLKRIPREYAQDHKRAELLKYKALYASTPGITPEEVTSLQLVDICFDRFRQMASLHQWLVKVGELV